MDKKEFKEVEFKVLSYNNKICLLDSVSDTVKPAGVYDGTEDWIDW